MLIVWVKFCGMLREKAIATMQSRYPRVTSAAQENVCDSNKNVVW
jgi:hypothetical protein